MAGGERARIVVLEPVPARLRLLRRLGEAVLTVEDLVDRGEDVVGDGGLRRRPAERVEEERPRGAVAVTEDAGFSDRIRAFARARERLDAEIGVEIVEPEIAHDVGPVLVLER